MGIKVLDGLSGFVSWRQRLKDTVVFVLNRGVEVAIKVLVHIFVS